MSFYSSLTFARSAPPPQVTVHALGELVAALATNEAIGAKGTFGCQLRFGERVDADEEGTDLVEWDGSGTIGRVGEYPWDRESTFESLEALAKSLVADSRSIYRAHLTLGGLRPEIAALLSREPSPQNEGGLYLREVSFSVGPVSVAGLASDAPAFVGWMALALSGYGYFYPWSFRHGRDRAEAVAALGQLCGHCRAIWPVPTRQPSPATIAARKELGALWLYDDPAVPPDWLWFASET